MSLFQMVGWLMGALAVTSVSAVSNGQSPASPFKVTRIDLDTSASAALMTVCREYGWDVEFSSANGSAQIPGTWIETEECSDFFACLGASVDLAWSIDGLQVVFLASGTDQPADEASATITLSLLVEAKAVVSWPGGQVTLDPSEPGGGCSPTSGDPAGPFECELDVEVPLHSDQPLWVSIAGSAELAGFRFLASTILRRESPPPVPGDHNEYAIDGVPDGRRLIETVAAGCYCESRALSSFGLFRDTVEFQVSAGGCCTPEYCTGQPWWMSACSSANAGFTVTLTRPHVAISDYCFRYCWMMPLCWLGGPASENPVSVAFPSGMHHFEISGDAWQSCMSGSCGGGAGSARFVRLNAADVWYDGIVGAEDLAMVLGNWGEAVNPARLEADVNMDGAVDALDIAMVDLHTNGGHASPSYPALAAASNASGLT
jgi:hypothetical protein